MTEIMYEFISPFAEYLHTNFVPSTIDRVHIQQLLKEPEAEAVKLDDEISRLKNQLDDVMKRKALLDEAINEHYQLLTPFRRLPDDILREMFLWCLPDNHNALMSVLEAPLLLGHVCSRWRALAYHTPRLWATLHIPLPIPPSQAGLSFWIPTDNYQKMCVDFEQKFQHHCAAVRDWLDRSGNCSLSISINPRDSVPIMQNRYVRTYLKILVDYSHRWRSLEASIPTGEYSSFFASINQTSVPRLEFLHLKFSRRAVQENVWTDCGIFNAKKLRVLHLSQFPYRLSSLEMDWCRITHLIMSDTTTSISRNKRITVEEAYKVFSVCSSLRHCVMDIIDQADDVNLGSVNMISLPNLESLSIVDGAICSAQLFERFDVPALRNISYHTSFWPSTRRRSPLLLLLQRTNNQLDSLTTDLQFFSVSELVECFELVPSLMRLTNTRSHLGLSREQARSRSGLPLLVNMMKAILNILLPTSVGDQCLCPKLCTIRLKESLVLTAKDAIRFIRERIGAPGVERLKEVYIVFSREPVVDVAAEVKDYVEDGLKLVLAFPPPRRISPGNFSPFNGLVKRDTVVPEIW